MTVWLGVETIFNSRASGRKYTKRARQDVTKRTAASIPAPSIVGAFHTDPFLAAVRGRYVTVVQLKVHFVMMVC